MAVVGSYVGLSKALVAVFPVFLLAWLRFGIAAVAMLGWLRAPAGEKPISRRDSGLLFVESFFGNFMFSICMLSGMALSSALAAGVIMAALPAVIAILSKLFLHERIEPRVGVGIACAVGGIALVSISRQGASGDTGSSMIGNLLLFGAVCCEAIFVVVSKRLSARVGPKRISALINLCGFALVAPLGLWQAVAFDFHAVSAPSWAFLACYSIAASVITVWLWMTGLRHVDAASAGIFTVLLPVSAALVGIVFFGERFNAAQAGAFMLALFGIVLATWPERSGPAASAA
jgi:drug/metabolite transporter (DMT)-like permease